jgi:hypothetical protein
VGSKVFFEPTNREVTNFERKWLTNHHSQFPSPEGSSWFHSPTVSPTSWYTKRFWAPFSSLLHDSIPCVLKCREICAPAQASPRPPLLCRCLKSHTHYFCSPMSQWLLCSSPGSPCPSISGHARGPQVLEGTSPPALFFYTLWLLSSSPGSPHPCTSQHLVLQVPECTNSPALFSCTCSGCSAHPLETHAPTKADPSAPTDLWVTEATHLLAFFSHIFSSCSSWFCTPAQVGTEHCGCLKAQAQ